MDCFFLVGAHRSGTTLLRLLLGHHPEVCRCEEMEFIVPAFQGMSKDEYRTWLETDRNFLVSGCHVDWHKELPEIAHDFLRQRQRMDGREIVGATVHNDFHVLPRIWPNARFIFLARDPRDVAFSCMKMGWHGTAWHAAQEWIRAQDSFAALTEQVAGDRVLQIRFQDLLSATEATLTSACEFLGTAFDADMLAIDRDTTYSRPSSSQANSWRETAKSRDIREVETRIGVDRITSAGYEVSGLPPVASGPVGLTLIRIRDAANRIRFRWRKYGVFLWLAQVVTNRIPIDPLRRTVKLRVNRIDEMHLK